MPTVVLKNVVLLLDGAALHGEFSELSVEYGAESLDATTFGNTTRIHKGGLFTGAVSGSGFVALGQWAAEQLLSSRLSQDDTIIVAFPNGVTEGVACGYGMRGVVESLQMGGAVGVLLPFTMAAAAKDLG